MAIPFRPRSNEKVGRAVHPNAGLRAAYQRRLQTLIAEMSASFRRFILAAYRKNEPAMAQDATPAEELQEAINKLADRWLTRFDEEAPKLAEWFANKTQRRSDAALKAILRDAGFSVKFKMTRPMRDVFAATVEQNVQLIKSIPEQYLTQVQGAVMRSVQAGRDLGPLAKELEHQFGVTKRRAALISLNQNNMATGAMQRTRQVELGIEEAVWLHSHAGKEPRPTHLANNGKRYNIAAGWFDPDPKVRRHIRPGELINCRCVSKPIIRGFS